jgi:predicted membrane channel-forming protein YqfA (hemolysin III family)
LNRKKRFFLGLAILTVLFILPSGVAASVGAFQWLAIFLLAYSLGVYQTYRMTIRNIKPKYPLVDPEGHPDIYSGRMPRPIYEDMERYAWFFRERHRPKNKKRHIRKKD